ncbi:hypothetical protein AVEN_99573-1 [Araneus ventricosus]|uniref:Uncharacterized protein n=1 Tax=Araneus ventricosus TaxID=182803 RepID=A0A4Y2ID05_ARAVE|nr:hypothetical protein AVEN_99573-1 [Araneus ventricosus]
MEEFIARGRDGSLIKGSKGISLEAILVRERWDSLSRSNVYCPALITSGKVPEDFKRHPAFYGGYLNGWNENNSPGKKRHKKDKRKKKRAPHNSHLAFSVSPSADELTLPVYLCGINASRQDGRDRALTARVDLWAGELSTREEVEIVTGKTCSTTTRQLEIELIRKQKKSYARCD